MPRFEDPGSGNEVLPYRSKDAGVANGHAASQLAQEGPPGISSAPNLLKLLSALRRRWRLAVGLGMILATVAATGAWFFIPPQAATARTQVRVLSFQPKIVFETAEARTDFANYQRAQMAIIKSRLVLNNALRKREVAELSMVREKIDPVEWLEKNIKADFSIAPEILRITLSGDHPQELITLVDAVRDSYLDEIVNKEQNQRLNRLDKLKQLHTKWDDDLQKKRRTLKKMASGLGSGDTTVLAEQQKFAQAQLNTLQTELLQLQAQIRKANLEVLAQENQEKALANVTIPEEVIGEWIAKDPVVAGHAKEIKQLEIYIGEMKSRAVNVEAQPAYKPAVLALESAKKRLADRRKELQPEIGRQLRDKALSEAKTKRVMEQDRIALLQKLEKVLSEEVKQRTQQADRFKKGTIDLEWLRDEILHVEKVAMKVGDLKQALEVEMPAPPRVELLEKAVISDPQSGKRALTLAMVAAFGAFVLGLGLVALWEFAARRISSTDEVVHGLGIHLVGSLPRLPNGAKLRLGSATGSTDLHWHNLMTESVDAVRAALLHTARKESLRVIMVTSALGGEGKTLLSCQLAGSLARAGCKTLLIDGDLRRPSVHKLFDLELPPGLCEILRDEQDMDSVVRPGPVPGLAVLPAGLCDGRALQALGQERIAALFARLKESYDLILVDSPPVLPVADSLLIGQQVDGVVFSILRDVSRLPMVHTAYERLAMLNIRMLGAVVNGTHRSFEYKSASMTALAA